MPPRRRWHAILAAALLVSTAGRADEPAAGIDCFDLAIVTVYLHHVQDVVMEGWGVPDDTLADQEVVVGLQIAEDGELIRYEILSFTNTRVSRSVAAALARVERFEPIPDEARCIVGKRIVLKFQNVY